MESKNHPSDISDDLLNNINAIAGGTPLSAQELQNVLDRAEGFRGTKINPEAQRKLALLTELCRVYQSLSPYSQVIAPPPVNNERNAFVILIQPLPAMITNIQAKENLSRLFYNADSFMIANSDAGLTLSFCVENIWEA